ncbi:MAG: AAA family ATPase [Deltaproteobacteria bacterium]|nr:AAA family ATPase [Deltaproteobacteria bacterium]
MSENMLYADKTECIYNLVNNYKACYLCRPRRFGKSILLSAIESLFSGERELFKKVMDLCIYSSDYTFQKHTVIHVSMDFTDTS